MPLQQNATPDIAYIFAPRDGDGGPVELLALNISASVSGASSSSSSAPVSLSSDLPFLAGPDSSGADGTTAFSASLADNGTIVVFAGDCASAATESSIWTFDPSAGGAGAGEEGAASWTRQGTTAGDGAGPGERGPGFLGSSLSFSTTLEPEMSKATVYVYGGMCPDADAAGAGPAQSNATYSNQMLRIAPSPESDEGGYAVAPAASKGPPVAAAGFTLTALPPSIANRSSGSVTQQVNYVLLGGHTRRAFVDMGTVALWSLPEESWGFVSEIGVVGSTKPGSDVELAVKSQQDAPDGIDSRSGHTAVLNEDGTALIVLGGWVGDLGQAAEPQLAVLHIGADYGGDGDWRWSVPADAQPPGPGLYGHGAALLPGNVMLVYGGYSISPSGSSKARKRQGVDGGSGGVPMFLNLTSMTWTDDYTNPLSRNAHGNGSGGQEMDSDGSEDTSEDQKKRLGFGLGLGLGVLAILAGVLAWLFYRRRQRHRRTIRNSALQALAQDTSHFIHDDYNEMAESRHSGVGDGGGGVFPWYAGGPDPHGRGAGALGYKTLRSSHGRSLPAWHGGPQQARGNLMTSALPPRGGPAGRGQYQPTPTGPIHPIYEAD